MKNNLKTRLMAALLCLLMVFSVSCGTENSTTGSTTTNSPNTAGTTLPASTNSGEEASPTPENGAEKIVLQERNVYFNPNEVIPVAFASYESTPEILMIDTRQAESMFFDRVLIEFTKYEFEETETTLKIKRNNGAYCILDFVADTVYYNDFDLFYSAHTNAKADILASTYVDSEGNSIYFSRTDSTNISGLPVLIDLASRDIPLDIYENTKYIPFQTFNDLFFTPNAINFLYNTNEIFMATGASLDPALKERYYSVEPAEKSQALADYTYRELCLVLDLFYGLQTEHGVNVGFDVYLEHIGLADDLRSTDPTKSSTAIASLMGGYLADVHSQFIMASPYTGSAKIDHSNVKYAHSFQYAFEFESTILNVRKQVLGENVPGYYEIGNTAYITLDSFTMSPVRFNDYSEATGEIGDTLELIIRAHREITRENSPIENVVLDLSCNGGGAADAAVYVVAWMLGYCDLHLTNPVTNNFSTASYKVDVNLDGIFDEKDTVADKNLYCLISFASFSCGNLVPALLKESGRVTLLGGTSGGGSCAVMFASAADGTLFQISSPLCLATVANGSYYNIDRGVDPHVHFSKMESFFKREALTEYLNGVK